MTPARHTGMEKLEESPTMQFIRRRYQVLAALVLGPLGILLATTVATAGENWSP